jgi:hypothetical protein
LSTNRKRKDGVPVAQASTPRLLDGNNYRSFWISWANGHVTAGEGTAVGDQTFIDFVDTSPIDVHYISICGKLKPGSFIIDRG